MELHFTPEQQAQLAQLATKAGADPEHLVMDAALPSSPKTPVSAPPCGKVSRRRTGANSSRKRKGTLASRKCFAHKLRIRWTPTAATDMRKLYGTIRDLKDWPGRGRPGNEEGTREILFPPLPYVAVYRVTAQTIEVLRVYHAAQDRR